MIPRAAASDATPTAPSASAAPAPAPAPGRWRRLLAQGVGSVGELLELLELDPATVGGAARDPHPFPLKVPRGFVARMRKGDPRDPLLLQVLPRAVEDRSAAGFSQDPLGESGASPRAGLLHKYRGRALWVVTGACAIHCRYCFRRHFPYDGHVGMERWERALEHLAADPSISEVILSGGDPLVLSDRKLASLAERIAALGHVRRLRIHTRLPVVLPERVDAPLLEWLTGIGRGDRLQPEQVRPVVVIHANHPQEIDPTVTAALRRLVDAGVTVLNQAVLLAGVNDDEDALAELSERLFEAGVLPYYLHALDRVQGAAHFEVPEERARELVGGLAARLPGYLVPRWVREVEGAPAKVPLDLRMEP